MSFAFYDAVGKGSIRITDHKLILFFDSGRRIVQNRG